MAGCVEPREIEVDLQKSTKPKPVILIVENPVKLDGAACKKNDTLGIDGIGENLNGKISLQFQTVLTTSYFFHR